MRLPRALRPSFVPALIAVAALVGCASEGLPTLPALTGGQSLTIRSIELGEAGLGSTRHLVILDGEGRRSARAFVHEEMVRQARREGYFRVEDRSNEGHEVQVADRQAILDGGRRRMPRDQAGLRIDIRDWSTERELRTVSRIGADGDRIIEHVPVRHGTVVLAVTLFDSKGVAHIADRDFQGRSEIKEGATRRAALEAAARDAVTRVLQDLSPRVVTREVKLDAQDPLQKPTLDLAVAGSVAQAADAAADYLQRNPSSPSAAYNLAVLLDASGKHAQALAMYDRALAQGGQAYYADARAGCERRAAAKRALAGRPVPASLSDAYQR